jgi:hypothetical protein
VLRAACRWAGVVALVGVAAVIGLVVTGPGVAGAGVPAQVGPRPVYVVGDSVMLGAETAVVAALAPVPVTVDAQQSRSLLGAVSLLQQHRPEMGDVVVVALGTNDGTDPAEFARRVDLVMGALQGLPHVLWVNQRVFAPGRAQLDAELTAASGRYPNLRVLDWNAVVDANPATVGPDGIHLTDAGKAAMANLVAGAVRDALAPPTTTTIASPVTAPPVTGAPGPGVSVSPARADRGASRRLPPNGFPYAPVLVGAAVAMVVAGFVLTRVPRRGREIPFGSAR